MRSFGEVKGVFYNENEILGTKTKDYAKLTIDFNSIISWNESDIPDTTTVELLGSGRYMIDISYDDFSEMMRQHEYKLENNSLQKLSPKDWFEKVFIGGRDVVWGTNQFTDIAAIELIQKYLDYVNSNDR